MAVLDRQGLSRDDKQDLWQRWKAGHNMSQIGRLLGKHPWSIQSVVSRHGGVMPTPRRRAARTLGLAEREEISRGLAAELSLRQIAKGLARPVSTVSREVARHGGRDAYRASHADDQAWDNALRPKLCRLAQQPLLRRSVAAKLALQWSPEQIAWWLKLRYPDDEGMRVSHETIYRSLFIQARGVLKKELTAHLRSRQKLRRSELAARKRHTRGHIIDAVSIRERPAEVEDRAVPGHWEGDLIAGAKGSHIATLVERHSRFVMLVKVEGKDTASVVSALTRQVLRLPIRLRKSLTWDQGYELASHKNFTVATDVAVYFCDPRSPWQRGSNENTNGLLRQYFPKGTDLSVHSQATLNKVALRLNQRPRQTLGFITPAEKLDQALQ
jgi:IS30 family transposase